MFKELFLPTLCCWFLQTNSALLAPARLAPVVTLRAENDKINVLDEPYFGTHILSDSLPSQTFEIPKKNTQPLISTRGLGCSGHQKSESFKTEL